MAPRIIITREMPTTGQMIEAKSTAPSIGNVFIRFAGAMEVLSWLDVNLGSDDTFDRHGTANWDRGACFCPCRRAVPNPSLNIGDFTDAIFRNGSNDRRAMA